MESKQTSYQRKLRTLINTNKKEKWMSSALLRSLAHTNTCLEADNNEYQIKQVNFETYERILKNDMKKTWATLDEKLDRQKFQPIILF